MSNSVIIKIIGVLLILAGLVTVMSPALISYMPFPLIGDPWPSETNIYQKVEHRSLWGILIGAGAILLVHKSLKPWLATGAILLASVPFGVSLARIIAIGIEGAEQLNVIWVFVDVALFGAIFWVYLWLLKRNKKKQVETLQ